MNHPKARRSFVPALRFRWLTGLYDPVVRLTTREWTVKRALLDSVGLDATRTLLDIGCGTATLLIEARRRRPGLDLIGVDIDAQVLAIGAAKAKRLRAWPSLVRASATRLPFEDASVDRVVSSLFFHHLDRSAKAEVASELVRVLVPGGELHLADWGRASNVAMRVAFLPVQLLDGFSNTSDNVRGELPGIFEAAGFDSVTETRRFVTVFGSLTLHKCTKLPYGRPDTSVSSSPTDA